MTYRTAENHENPEMDYEEKCRAVLNAILNDLASINEWDRARIVNAAVAYHNIKLRETE